MDVAQARDHGNAIIEAAEAAETDAFIFDWVMNRVGSGPEQAAGLLVDFRKYRAEVTGKRHGPTSPRDWVMPPPDKAGSDRQCRSTGTRATRLTAGIATRRWMPRFGGGSDPASRSARAKLFRRAAPKTMTTKFGQDELGDYKRLEGGRVLRVHRRMFNTLLTVSPSIESPWWSDGW